MNTISTGPLEHTACQTHLAHAWRGHKPEQLERFHEIVVREEGAVELEQAAQHLLDHLIKALQGKEAPEGVNTAAPDRALPRGWQGRATPTEVGLVILQQQRAGSLQAQGRMSLKLDLKEPRTQSSLSAQARS